jgi:hypothetical protein
MRIASRASRPIVRELALALVVLALAFLNFGHQSAVFAAGGRVVVTQVSVCGDPVVPGAGEHFACHACRPLAAILPPPPRAVLEVRRDAAVIAYAAPETPALSASPLLAARPRGPPAA